MGRKRQRGLVEVSPTKVQKSSNNSTESLEIPQEPMNFVCETKPLSGAKWNLKISSWNVDGIRAWLKKDGLKFLEQENPDVLCLQETKCSEKKLPEELKVDGYHAYWYSGSIEGYAGVGLYSKAEPKSVAYGIGDKEHDKEGRMITVEYDKFYLVATYVPNSGKKLVTLPKRLDWEPKFRQYLADLDAKKPVILCGDLNVSHKEIDLKNPKSNTRNAGFTKEERDSFSELLACGTEGFVDSFRYIYPDQTGAYTFWTYMMNCRARNVGWRLDYFIISKRLASALCDSVICHQVLGSDHCPITLFMRM